MLKKSKKSKKNMSKKNMSKNDLFAELNENSGSKKSPKSSSFKKGSDNSSKNELSITKAWKRLSSKSKIVTTGAAAVILAGSSLGLVFVGIAMGAKQASSLNIYMYESTGTTAESIAGAKVLENYMNESSFFPDAEIQVFDGSVNPHAYLNNSTADLVLGNIAHWSEYTRGQNKTAKTKDTSMFLQVVRSEMKWDLIDKESGKPLLGYDVTSWAKDMDTLVVAANNSSGWVPGNESEWEPDGHSTWYRSQMFGSKAGLTKGGITSTDFDKIIKKFKDAREVLSGKSNDEKPHIDEVLNILNADQKNIPLFGYSRTGSSSGYITPTKALGEMFEFVGSEYTDGAGNKVNSAEQAFNGTLGAESDFISQGAPIDMIKDGEALMGASFSGWRTQSGNEIGWPESYTDGFTLAIGEAIYNDGWFTNSNKIGEQIVQDYTDLLKSLHGIKELYDDSFSVWSHIGYQTINNDAHLLPADLQ